MVKNIWRPIWISSYFTDRRISVVVNFVQSMVAYHKTPFLYQPCSFLISTICFIQLLIRSTVLFTIASNYQLSHCLGLSWITTSCYCVLVYRMILKRSRTLEGNATYDFQDVRIPFAGRAEFYSKNLRFICHRVLLKYTSTIHTDPKHLISL